MHNRDSAAAFEQAKQMVVCRACDAPILLRSAERLSPEFCVRCPGCGRREFYETRHIKPVPGPRG